MKKTFTALALVLASSSVFALSDNAGGANSANSAEGTALVATGVAAGVVVGVVAGVISNSSSVSLPEGPRVCNTGDTLIAGGICQNTTNTITTTVTGTGTATSTTTITVPVITTY